MVAKRALLLSALTFILCGAFSADASSSSDEEDDVVKCTAYCDNYGYFQPEQTCPSSDDEPVYCCGDENTRYCCKDEDLDVGYIPPVSSCPKSWWYYQWRVIVGLLVTLIALLAVAACCYYCCGDPGSPRQVWRRNRRNRDQGQDNEINTVTGNVGENGGADDGPTVPTFDPDSPYAFMPPAYESLPKDPPKYCDIYENPAFENDDAAQASTSMPYDAANAVVSPEGVVENPRLQQTAPSSPPPTYETIPMPPVNDVDDRPVSVSISSASSTSASLDSSSSSEVDERNESRSVSCVSSSVITVSSNSDSDVEDTAEVELDSASRGTTGSDIQATQENARPRSEARLQDQQPGSVSNPLYNQDSEL